uniref:Protein SSUH2 homolog n=1 Tax=Bursaphelenchus xylophilus TaxID=6326 RepID=A0A1I7SEL1_BURXY
MSTLSYNLPPKNRFRVAIGNNPPDAFDRCNGGFPRMKPTVSCPYIGFTLEVIKMLTDWSHFYLEPVVIKSDEGQVNWHGVTKVLELPSTSKLVSCQHCNAEGVAHCFHCRGFGTDKCGYCRGTGMKAGVAHPALYTHPMVGTFPNTDMSRGYPGAGSAIVRPPNFSGNKPYAVGTPVHFMAKAGLPPPGIGHHDLCLFCQGRGIKDCHHCKGQGKKTCSSCGGHGSVRQYTKLKVFFAVERSDYFTHSEVPEILLAQASGEVSLMETQSYLMPIKKFPVNEINEVSKKLLAQHMQKSLGACRVIKQRQTVEAIPVAKVHWKLGKKSGIFYVFGTEKLCYIPKSPTKCSIM